MRKTIEGPLKFGDPAQIAFIKRIQKEDILKKKVTINYDELLQIGVAKSEAEDLIRRIVNYKKKK